MQNKIFLVGKVALLCCLASLTEGQWEGSGSGDGYGPDEFDMGSGDWPTWPLKPKPQPSPTLYNIFNPDDEDIVFSSGDGEPEFSGDGDENKPDENTRCSDSSLYCWCVDAEGNEILGTKKYIEDIDEMRCTDPFFRVQPAVTDKPETPPPETTTVRRRPRPTKKITKLQGFFTTEDGKPTVPAIPATANGRRGDEEDVSREKVLPLFTHPGILAAVVGGGVVTLLCALLLIMFIVYRMRKKDEGSYPLDPGAKPPRLHTYTRAPNKEFYA